MRAVIQRVREASVCIGGHEVSRIGPGLLVLLGIEVGDSDADVAWLAAKAANLRVLADDEGRMNRSVIAAGGEVMVVSQFTLHASTQKGNRPSFLRAAPPAVSEGLYEKFCDEIGGLLGRRCGRGSFGAEMQVGMINDGPVTILIDSRARE